MSKTKTYAMTYSPGPDMEYVTLIVDADHRPTPDELLERIVRNQFQWRLVADDVEVSMAGDIRNHIANLKEDNRFWDLEVRELDFPVDCGLYEDMTGRCHQTWYRVTKAPTKKIH